MIEWVWRIDGTMPTRKIRDTQRRTFCNATLSISNPSS